MKKMLKLAGKNFGSARTQSRRTGRSYLRPVTKSGPCDTNGWLTLRLNMMRRPRNTNRSTYPHCAVFIKPLKKLCQSSPGAHQHRAPMAGGTRSRSPALPLARSPAIRRGCRTTNWARWISTLTTPWCERSRAAQRARKSDWGHYS